MAEKLVTVIIAFHIILLVLYFIMRVHKHSVNKARDVCNKIIAGKEKEEKEEKEENEENEEERKKQ